MSFRKLLPVVLPLSVLGAASAPAHAEVSDLVDRICTGSCTDRTGTQSSVSGWWSALSSMGTTDFIGGQMGGLKIDASSLLAGSSVAGASELDRFLRTGTSSSPDITSSIVSMMSGGAGIDVSSLTGSKYSSLDTALDGGAETVASAYGAGGSSGQSGAGTASCDPAVENAMVMASRNYVTGVMETATQGDYAFSKMGGVAVSQSGSGGGMFGGSCLDKFMQGGRDLLFQPPKLSDLLSMTGGMFDGGGGSSVACGGGPSAMQQISGSMPSGLFQTGGGGFFPAFASGETESGVGGDTFANNLGIKNSTTASLKRSGSSLF